MQCPSCGAAKLAHDIRDMPYTYKSESTVIHSVNGAWCAVCGEVILDAEESTRVSAAMLAFNKTLQPQ